MKKYFFILIVAFLCLQVSAQGLRQSVCVVYPEYTDGEKTQMSDFSLHAARLGMPSMSRVLSMYKSGDIFGSGVLINYNGRKLVLTNRHVTGYAQTANVIFQLNKQNIRYDHCAVVAHSVENDLAVIELPESCSQIPLAIDHTLLEEGVDISAAGFPGLGNKPSWQLTRGTVSNAQLDMSDLGEQSVAIQHTASIDPGSSGGPLLIKKNGKYHIVGINTWKASYRDGVAIAIPAADIDTFLLSLDNPITNNLHVLENLQGTSGEQWSYMMRHLPDSMQRAIHDMDWNMPLEPVEKTLAYAENLQHSQHKSTKSRGSASVPKSLDIQAPHIENDMENRNSVQLLYDNFMGLNQRVSITFEHAWLGYIITGFTLGVPIVECRKKADIWGESTEPEYKLTAGFNGGVVLGGQLPINIKKYLLVPRVTQNVGVGPMFDGLTDIKFGLNADTRVGMAVHMPGSACDFILGLYYDCNFLLTSAQLRREVYKNTSSQNLYLQHGITLSLGIGF